MEDHTYNEGAGRLQTSTLLKILNTENYAGAAGQFGEWVYGGGVKLPGLVQRRDAEVAAAAPRSPLPLKPEESSGWLLRWW
jgi:lysozyme